MNKKTNDVNGISNEFKDFFKGPMGALTTLMAVLIISGLLSKADDMSKKFILDTPDGNKQEMTIDELSLMMGRGPEALSSTFLALALKNSQAIDLSKDTYILYFLRNHPNSVAVDMLGFIESDPVDGKTEFSFYLPEESGYVKVDTEKFNSAVIPQISPDLELELIKEEATPES